MVYHAYFYYRIIQYSWPVPGETRICDEASFEWLEICSWFCAVIDPPPGNQNTTQSPDGWLTVWLTDFLSDWLSSCLNGFMFDRLFVLLKNMLVLFQDYWNISAAKRCLCIVTFSQFQRVICAKKSKISYHGHRQNFTLKLHYF